MNKWTKIFKLTVRRNFGVFMVKVLNTLGCTLQNLWPIYTDFIFEDDILNYLHLHFSVKYFATETIPLLFKYGIQHSLSCSNMKYYNWFIVQN